TPARPHRTHAANTHHGSDPAPPPRSPPAAKPGSPALPGRDSDAAVCRDLDGAVVAGVGVADDAHARVVGQHALDLLSRQRRAIGDAHLTGVDRAPHAYSAAVMD